MALLDKDNRNAALAFAAGVGVGLLVPYLLPVLEEVARPLAKGAIKGGVIGYERLREALSHIRESAEDIVAEVEAELAEEETG